MFFYLIVFFSAGYVALDMLHHRWRDKRTPARAMVCKLKVLCGAIGFMYLRPVLQGFASSHPALALAALAGIAALVANAHGYRPAARAWLAVRWFFIIALPLTSIWFVAFYNTKDDCARVISDARIRPLLSTCAPHTVDNLPQQFPNQNWKAVLRSIQPRSVFLSTTPGLAYIGTGNEEEHEPVQILGLVQRSSGRLLRVENTPAVFRGFCDPATKKCTAAISGASALYVFDDATGKREKTIKFPVRPRFLLHPPDSRILYIGGDRDPIVSMFDLDTFSVIKQGRGLAFYRKQALKCLGDDEDQGMTFMAFNTKTRELNITPECPIYNTLLIRTSENIEKSTHHDLGFFNHLWSMGYFMGMEIDPDLNEIYITGTLSGSIFVYDYTTMKLKDTIRIGVGIRETDYDPKRKLLFAGHYINGFLYVVDVRGRAVRGRIFIGKRNRQLLFDPATNRVLTTSANGFLDVDVSEF
jgi:hypothetical protein